ncbi:MAG: hypothetical protein NTW06_00760, partial [Candidatus Falkowbacteria bacterium]|nr:hypothetical protein [Candidatus Falkowbacteria bacterium]
GDIGKILGIILFLFIEIIGPLLSIISFILFLVSLIKFKKEYFKKKLFFILLAVTQFVLYITYSAIAYFY